MNIIKEEIFREWERAAEMLAEFGPVCGDISLPYSTRIRSANPQAFDNINFIGEESWPDNIIFKQHYDIFFATRKIYKGTKSKTAYVVHREDGPAMISVRERNHYASWVTQGEYNRLDGPAYMFYIEQDWFGCEYCKGGKWHNTFGPALASMRDGNIHLAWYEDHKYKDRMVYGAF